MNILYMADCLIEINSQKEVEKNIPFILFLDDPIYQFNPFGFWGTTTYFIQCIKYFFFVLKFAKAFELRRKATT